MLHRLFVYGTLHDPTVQCALFGRVLDCTPAELKGWQIAEICIDDPRVVALSGLNMHRILEPGTGDDRVEGWILELSDADLVKSDEYETINYKRVATHLEDGSQVFVYVNSSCY